MIVELEGISLHLAHPDELTVTWVGQDEVMRQLLAAWLVIDSADLPMNPRLLGKPGVGKTTLAYAAAKRLGREVYILQATVDTRPEDLLITPVIEGEARLRYVASPLVSAMLRGGVAILDEGNRMSEKSWASLAPLLDNRRYVESIVAGVKIRAHPLFRMVATMNDDASTFDLPEYIHSRLQPQILIDFPERHEEFAILRENLPVRRSAYPELRHRFPPTGALGRRALHGSRRDQHRAFCDEARPGSSDRRRERVAAHRNRADPRRRGPALCPSKLNSNPEASSGGVFAIFRWRRDASSSQSNCSRLLLPSKLAAEKPPMVAVELPGISFEKACIAARSRDCLKCR